MSYNEQEIRHYLIDPVLRVKDYDDHRWLKLETLAPVEPTRRRGRRRRGAERPANPLCVRVSHIDGG